MELEPAKIFKTLNLKKIWVPIFLGIGIVFILLLKDSQFTFEKIKIIRHAKWQYILLAFLAIIIRDWGYAYRIKTLTKKSITWKSSFYIIILWEFASAVTPSVVGGSAIAVFILLKENIKFGRSLAYVMLTAIFDNLFFIITAPFAILVVGNTIFSHIETLNIQWQGRLIMIFWLSYGLIALYTLFMFFGLFSKPKYFKIFLLKITKLKFLRRWRKNAYIYGQDMLVASQELKGHSRSYWFKIVFSTAFIWSARYIILNLLIASFVQVSFTEHLIIFGKHIMMWVMMLISPTPGSSGTAEFFFQQLYENILGDYTLITDLSWRLMTYYLYLLIGAIFLPTWLKRKFVQHPIKKI